MSNSLVFVAPQEISLEPVIGADGFPIVCCGEQEIPVIDDLVQLEIIQPGHLQNPERKEELKPHVKRFYAKSMEESYEELHLAPLQVMFRGRSLFPPYDEGDRELLCYSLDGETPAPKVDAPIAPACGVFKEGSRGVYFEAACPKAKWPENGSGKPECSDNILVAFFDLDRQMPVSLSFKGKAISAWNAFQRSYRQKRNAARIKRQSIYDYAIKATLEDEGTYVQLKLEFYYAGDENPAQYAPLLSWYREHLIAPKIAEMEAMLADMKSPTEPGAYEVNVDADAAAPAADGDDADQGESFTV